MPIVSFDEFQEMDMPVKSKKRVVALDDFESLMPGQYPDASADLQIPTEQIDKWKSQGPIGYWEQATRTDLTEMIPFNPERAVKSLGVLNAVKRFQADEYGENLIQKDKDVKLIKDFLYKSEEKRIRGYTTAGKITAGITELPSFMGEFLLTGGLASAGKKAVQATATKLIGEAAEKGVTGVATKVAGMAAGAALRTPLMGGRIAEGFAQRQLNANLELTDKGLAVADTSVEAPATSLMKSIGDVMIENFSEETGELIAPALGYVGGKLVSKRMANGLVKLWNKVKPGEDVNKLLTKSGYNGFLAEMGEERVGNFLRAVLNIDDFGAGKDANAIDRLVASIPNGEELLVEAGVLSVPGLAGMAMSNSLNFIREKNKGKEIKVDVNVPDEVIEPIAQEMVAEKTAEAIPEAQPAQPLTAEEAVKSQDYQSIIEAAGGKVIGTTKADPENDIPAGVNFNVTLNGVEDTFAMPIDQVTPDNVKAAIEKKQALRDSYLKKEEADIYEQNYALKKSNIKVKKSNIGEGFSSFVDKAFVPLSTRASKVSEKLRTRLRKFEFDIMQQNKADFEAVIPFLSKAKSIDEKDFVDLDFALKNSDISKIDEIVSKNNLGTEYQQIRATLDSIYARAKEAGVDVNYLEDYFPRSIIDVKGFLDYLRGTENWSAIEKDIKAKEAQIGRAMDESEKAVYANLLLRGYGEKTNVKKSRNIKGRKIAVLTPEMNQFYKDAPSSLIDYITSMNNMIEAQNLIGKNSDKLDESIGAYVERLINENVIAKDQEQEVKDILRARLQAKGTWGFWAFYKNASYIYTMGSPISAITQIGDLYNSLYQNGVYDTFTSLVDSITNKSKVTKEDLGIEAIADEFRDSTKSGKAVTTVFKTIGLDFMDSIGKNTLINSSLTRLQNEAKANKTQLKDKLVDIFGEEADQTLKDLVEGELSPNVKMLLFSELSNFQPISLSEMPEYYVKGGNLRVFYMLKSYTLKLLDVYHNEVFRQMKTDPLKASKNLLGLTFALMLTGASADALKDLLLGRKIDLSDMVIDNILKLMGFSKWQIYKAREDGLLDTLMQSVLPPTPFLDDIYKDIVTQKELPDWQTASRVPYVGKFYYWWFGGGRKKEEKKARKKRKSRVL